MFPLIIYLGNAYLNYINFIYIYWYFFYIFWELSLKYQAMSLGYTHLASGTWIPKSILTINMLKIEKGKHNYFVHNK